MQKIDWSKVTESTGVSGNNRPPVGGYVLEIVETKENESKEYFEISWDYKEGQYAGHNMKNFNERGWRLPRYFASYKLTAQGLLLHFMLALEKSNRDFDKERWNDLPCDKKAPALNGLVFGAVVGEEEYPARDGKIKIRQYIADTISAADIRAGKFKVPALKKLKGNSSNTPAPAAENPATNAPIETGVEECPF